MNNTDCLVPLTQGKFAVVSPEDYEFLSQFKWYAAKEPTTYGYRWCAVRESQGKRIYMHRLIAERAGFPECKRYDHKDRNGLNNTRGNLRACTQSQNLANQTKSFGKSSSYKGVSWDQNKWLARIMVNRRAISLGRFHDELDAHRAYAEAAVRYFREFACP